jgi:hypothetical protein
MTRSGRSDQPARTGTSTSWPPRPVTTGLRASHRPSCGSAVVPQGIPLRDGNRRRWTENTAGARRTGRGYLRVAPRSDGDVRSPGEIHLADTGDRR